ncbi:DUF2157 domain-containing protein [Ensifer sp.]|jgi:uncharacterized membrane protein|uniref:DUF2157 domain-containing protein n=1 Tax=Ensifer sp. TaxID=1872086 RepID=UPI002E122E74|nr:DUF2157 domain-containing protein [Ensifer sp.]
MYRARLERDFKGWIDKGLLPESAARAMLAEYDGRESTFRAGRVLLVLAALLLSASILLLVAANWEALPRLARVVGIIALVWGLHFAAAWLARAGRSGLAASALVIGSASFGGGIALIGQMYHLSGDAADAALLWFAGAALSAVAFRSATMTAAAGGLAWFYFGTVLTESNFNLASDWRLWSVPALAILVVLLVRFTDAGRARHLAYLLVLAWLSWLYVDSPSLAFAGGLAASGLAAFLAAAMPGSPLRPLAMEAGSAPAFYSFALALLGFAALQYEAVGLTTEIVTGACTLLVALLGIAVAGAQNGAVRYLGYVAFAGELLYLAFETLGSMLGTSGFFLISGLVVAGIAWLVIRIEGHMARARRTEASQ